MRRTLIIGTLVTLGVGGLVYGTFFYQEHTYPQLPGIIPDEVWWAHLEHQDKEKLLYAEWNRLGDELLQIGNVEHNGEIVNIFSLDVHNKPGLSTSELQDYYKQARVQLKKNERKRKAAFRKLKAWQKKDPMRSYRTNK